MLRDDVAKTHVTLNDSNRLESQSVTRDTRQSHFYKISNRLIAKSLFVDFRHTTNSSLHLNLKTEQSKVERLGVVRNYVEQQLKAFSIADQNREQVPNVCYINCHMNW